MAGRKRRHRCEAHHGDGQPCQARAIPGGTVCEKHGGSAPQVRRAAGRNVLLERYAVAWAEIGKHEQGSERWYHAWDRFNAAEQALRQYEGDLELIAAMRAEVRDPSGDPEVVATLLAVARARLDGRPWT